MWLCLLPIAKTTLLATNHHAVNVLDGGTGNHGRGRARGTSAADIIDAEGADGTATAAKGSRNSKCETKLCLKFECSPQNFSLKERDSGISDAGRRRDREATQKEVDKLRESIQTLTRSANPLGKLMDFLQEDVDAMQRELDTWKQVRPFPQNWNQSYTQRSTFYPYVAERLSRLT